MSWVDYVGFLAALTVLATFCMDTILPLRGLAIASNILFIVYGFAAQLYHFCFTLCCFRSTLAKFSNSSERTDSIGAATCCARPARPGPSIASHSLADSVRPMVHVRLNSQRENPGLPRNQGQRWR